MRTSSVTVLLCLLGVLILSVAGTAGGEPQRLTLLFTNDVQGYIEPCG
jgi:hypothetical protein